MSNRGRSNWVWFLAGILLVLLAGCKGFFVNPSLTAITVTPLTPTVTAETGTPPTCPSGDVCTVQLVANATYSDGTTGTVAASWSTSNNTIATVGASTGLVTGVGVGSATITAAASTLTGSTTVTVMLANLVSIQVTPTNPSIDEGQSQQFTAMGTVSGGGTVDITDSVTWNSSNTCVTITSGASGGLATAQSCSASTTSNITAVSGTITSNTAVLSVTVP